MGLYTSLASYTIECGINKEVVVIECSSDVCNQTQAWNSVIKHSGVSLKLLL